MNLFLRQFAAALVFCPPLLCAQQAPLPSAPSAVMEARNASQHDTVTFPLPAVSFDPATVSATLNSNQKFSAFVQQSMSPYATFSAAVAAGFRPNWSNSPYPQSYASRMGQGVADQSEQGFFTKFLLPTFLHQDPRYYASTDDSYGERAAYALSRIFVTRNDNGKSALNTSELLGAVLAASITTAYHPIRRPTPGQVAGGAASTMGTDAGLNMFREFWPDIREGLMDHGPRMVQTLVARFGPRVSAAPPAPAN